MKKIMIQVTAMITITCFGFTASAQQSAVKQKNDNPGRSTGQPTAPVVSQEAAKLKIESAEQPKPIIAGGDYKPASDNPVLREPVQQPVEKYVPIIPPVNTATAKRPVVIEQNTPANQPVKPVAQLYKEQ
jgi:hypothetical protein